MTQIERGWSCPLRLLGWVLVMACAGSAMADGPSLNLSAPPSPHLQQIANMGSNSWLRLGTPAPDPVYGAARTRSWSAQMAYAPSLGGAFLYGEGPHGGMFDATHYGDELYFYDAQNHAWQAVWPGFDVNRYDEVTWQDGMEYFEGHPTPIASMVHGYEMLSYDTKRERFMFMPIYNIYWQNNIPDRADYMTANGMSLVPKRLDSSPFVWDVNGEHWDRFDAPANGPDSRYGHVMHYIPDSDTVWYWDKNRVWNFDPETNVWSQPTVSGPAPPFGIEPTSCYDPTRNWIYMGGGSWPTVPEGENALWIYDLNTDSWIDPAPLNVPANGDTWWSPVAAMMHYDTVNDVLVLFKSRGDAEDLGVYVYDPDLNSWTVSSLEVPPIEDNEKWISWSGYYDPDLNAHFVWAGRDGSKVSEMYAYRVDVVPEPTTLLLLGLGGWTLMRKRRVC